jgi:hypothetical protein
MSVIKQIAEYLYLKKKDTTNSTPESSWIKYMHGINRISIFMFLLGMVILVFKLFFKKG